MLKLHHPLLLTFAFVNGLQAQGLTFLYVTNIGSNNISAYSINSSTGALTPVPGSPFPGGGEPDWITIDPSSKFAYVTNRQGNSVSGYAISSTGALIAVPGSPFVSGTAAYGAGVDPLGRFVYVNSAADNTLSGYAINQQTGALTPVPGSPFPTGAYPIYDVAFTPNGRSVYDPNYLGQAVSGFAIDAQTGALTALPGSPFPIGGYGVSLAIEPQGKYSYLTINGSPAVYAFKIDAATGGLSPVSGSPFAVGVPCGCWITIDPAARFLFASQDVIGGGVNAFAIDQTSGALTAIPGSPFPTGQYPAFMAVYPSGKFLYVGNNGSNNISAFTIDQVSGVLSPVPGSPFSADGQAVSLAIAAPTVATGTIRVTTNLSAATFTIIGPVTYTGDGMTFAQSNAPAGTYTITYGAVSGYAAPQAQTTYLSGSSTLSFSSEYQRLTGDIGVVTNNLSADFNLSGPASLSGIYKGTFNAVPAGSYTITYLPIGGYRTPPPEDKTLPAGGSISFSGTYELASGTGSIRVSVSPSTATYSVTGPASFAGTGSVLYSTLPPGTYTIIFNPLPASALLTPAAQSWVLTPGSTPITFTGKYLPVLPPLRLAQSQGKNIRIATHLLATTAPGCLVADVELSNLTGTWYQLDVQFGAGTTTAHTPIDVSQLPYYSFLIGPWVGTDRPPLKFPAVHFCGDQYLAVDANKLSLASALMISTDIVTRGLLGAPFPSDWAGALDLNMAELQALLSSTEIGNIGDAVAVGLCRDDPICVANSLADLVEHLVKNPQTWAAIQNLVGKAYGTAAAQKWLGFLGESVGDLFDLWSKVQTLTDLMNSTWTAPDRDGFRIEAVR